MNYQDILEEKLITETKTHFFMIDEKDLIKELSVHAIAELSDLNADGVCDKEVIDDAISDAQSYIASFIKIPKSPTPLLKDICVKLTIMELKRRNDFPKESLEEIKEWANDLLLKMANKKIPTEIDEDNFIPQNKVRAFKIKRKRMDLRRING
ncbi:DUF1320 domain-containing protein [Campylobacter coli]|nr:DUF1320 domain-containing protein [Campylobacter coli]